MVAAGADLTDLPRARRGALAGKIGEIVRTGTCEARRSWSGSSRRTSPGSLRLPGLGPKRVHALHYDLDHTPENSTAPPRTGDCASCPASAPRPRPASSPPCRPTSRPSPVFKLATAARYAEPLVAWLGQTPGVRPGGGRGQLQARRPEKTVGDLDILVMAEDPDAAIRRFVAYDEVAAVRAQAAR